MHGAPTTNTQAGAPELQQLEELCNAFYGNDMEARTKAHDILLTLLKDCKNIYIFENIFLHSRCVNTLIYAATALSTIYQTHWHQIPSKQKEFTKNFLFNYLFSNTSALLVLHDQHGASHTTENAYKNNHPNLLLGHVIRLLCKLIKLGWLEDANNKRIIDQVNTFLSGSTSHWVVGLYIYTELTQEMQVKVGVNISRNRRIAFSFRDIVLCDIYKVGIKTLEQYIMGTICISVYMEEIRLLKQILLLIHNCLSFDFLATVPDDTTDEQITVNIPQNWNVFRDPNTPKLFFSVYAKCIESLYAPLHADASSLSSGMENSTPTDQTIKPRTRICVGGKEESDRIECGRLSLCCLVLIAAFRRSFFGRDEERLKYMDILVQGTKNILETSLGIDIDVLYHEICRLISRINTSQHITEIFSNNAANKMDNIYISYINILYVFTINSLENWKHLPNSKHYLLNTWANIMNPVLFYKYNNIPKYIFNNIHHITQKFILSRIILAEYCATHPDDDCDFENPLHNPVLRQEQLEVISQLGRCMYTDTAQTVLSLYEDVRNRYQQNQQEVFIEQITWIVYFVGALIGNSWSAKLPAIQTEGKNSEMAESIEGALCKLVFSLIQDTRGCVQTPQIEALELAYLYFLNEFKKILIADYAKHSNKTNPTPFTLAKALGCEDDQAVLNMIVSKIFYNMQNCVQMFACIKQSLELLSELSIGVNIIHYSNKSPQLVVFGKLLLQDSVGDYLLRNHTSEEFAFLSAPKYSRLRTTYYTTLTKLLFMDTRENKVTFEVFMQPFSNVMDSLWQTCAGGSSSQALSRPDCRQSLIYLARDLKGIAGACTSVATYMQLFTWLVTPPKHLGAARIHIFAIASECYWGDAEVMVPILKCVAEFACCRGQRISFDSASANGILLFKEVTQILLSYAQRILTKANFVDLYKEKYKGIACALRMYSNALSGGYVNFGVFDIYGDRSLKDTLSIALQMCIEIPQSDLQAYFKALQPFYTFVDLATKSFMPQVLEMPPPKVAHIIRCLEDGICSFESCVSMESCSAMDNVVSFFYQNKDSAEPAGMAVRTYLGCEPDSLKRVLQLLFQLVTTGDTGNMWCISRPLLGLISLFPDEFMLIRRQVVEQQPAEKQITVDGHFNDLMKNVEKNLEVCSKENFTRNLYQFSADIRNTYSS